jgi:hypothetical protein
VEVRLQRFPPGLGRLDRLGQRLVGGIEHGQQASVEDFLLAGEVVVDGRLRHAERGRDVLERGVREPLGPEQGRGRVQDHFSLVLVLAVAVERRQCRFRHAFPHVQPCSKTASA